MPSCVQASHPLSPLGFGMSGTGDGARPTAAAESVATPSRRLSSSPSAQRDDAARDRFVPSSRPLFQLEKP